ncbi:MAG: tetratricopeptide repeat protein, partial [Alphaproteobacteria bacterium]
MKPAASIAQLERLLRSGLQAQAAGRLDEAAGLYGRALALHPSCADALHLLGQARFLAQRADEALGLVDRAIAIAPATPSYLNTRGVILRALDRATEAIASFRAAIALDARHAGARKNLAGGLASTG